MQKTYNRTSDQPGQLRAVGLARKLVLSAGLAWGELDTRADLVDNRTHEHEYRQAAYHHMQHDFARTAAVDKRLILEQKASTRTRHDSVFSTDPDVQKIS